MPDCAGGSTAKPETTAGVLCPLRSEFKNHCIVDDGRIHYMLCIGRKNGCSSQLSSDRLQASAENVPFRSSVFLGLET